MKQLESKVEQDCDHLIVLLDCSDGISEIASNAPSGSLIVSTVELPSLVAGQSIVSVVIPSSLAALGELLRAHESDVLLLSERRILSPDRVSALRAGLAADSACATVSVDEMSTRRETVLPPPGIVMPRPGAVLVRRDHLMLALSEAEYTAGAEAPPSHPTTVEDGLIGQVLTALVRPGFIHRAVAPAAEAPPRQPIPRVALAGPFAADVVLDGRSLDRPISGTQVQLFGLAGGLARSGARVAVMRPQELHPSVISAVARLAKDVPFVERFQVPRPAVFHRPFQTWSLHDVADCLSIGERLVLTHQDMILDRTPAYAKSIEEWLHYRQATAAALPSADEVGFFSRHAAADAASDGLVELDRATVVPLGVDHLGPSSEDDTVADPLHGRPYVLVLGHTYWHKNRLFSLRLVQWLIEQEGWDGGLVLAGGDTGLGSSVAAEQAMLGATPSLRSRVFDAGYVSDAERAALYRGADLVLFPSLYEGFGLIPFEAAAFGTASVYTFRASMQELLPKIGGLPSFDLDAAGPFVSALLSNAVARDHLVSEITRAAAPLTWDRTATGYLEVYGRALAREPRSVSRLLVGVDPLQRRHVSGREARLLDVYGQQRVFRFAVDGAFRVARVLRRAGVRRRRERS